MKRNNYCLSCEPEYIVNSEFLTAIQHLDVKNVFIYVGDAVRWDAVPDSVSKQGSTVKTIAASTHSPSSFASIATGLYTPVHGVSMFSHQLPNEVYTIFDTVDESRFVNSIFAFADREHGETTDPIYSVLNREPPDSDIQLADLSEPFVFMERGPGGHAPYGDFRGAATDYFREVTDEQTLRSDYQRSISLDASVFEKRLAELEESGLRDDTLVIYTSDHGELLGEGGMLGHSSPMRPELVYVPTVLIHPDLPHCTVSDISVHHVDIAPTILNALNLNHAQEKGFNGSPIGRGGEDGPRPTVYRNRFSTTKLPLLSDFLHYEGAWDTGGGYVFARTPMAERLAILSAKLLRSSKRVYMRKNIPQVVASYSRSDAKYGMPSFTKGKADWAITRATSKKYKTIGAELSNTAKKQLRDLGYR